MVNLQQIFALIQSKRKTTLPWQREQPVSQPYYSYSPSTSTWEPITTPPTTPPTATTPLTHLSILSWNIDFMLPHPTPRMAAALSHLRSLITTAPLSSTPSIIFLAETLESDLVLLRETPWVRDHFHLTDLDAQYWESGHYGTVMLVDRRVTVERVWRVHYEATNMERDGLFVDVNVGGTGEGGRRRVVRVCTTHLESLIADPPLRPRQVETVARWLFGSDGVDEGVEVVGGVMGGDFNAIQDFDHDLHANNGLEDAFLETGGKEGSEDGFTWGQMAPVKQREMFGCSRMDKLWYGGQVVVEKFERFGLGVTVGDKEVEEQLVKEEGMEKGWVTDHAGVWGTFKIVGGGIKGEQRASSKI